MHNVYQLIVINIFLILTVISGVNLQPQIDFNVTEHTGSYRYLYIGYDLQRTFITGILLGFIYILIELSIFLKRKQVIVHCNYKNLKEMLNLSLKIKLIISSVITVLLCYSSITIITDNAFFYTVTSISIFITLYYLLKLKIVEFINRFTR